GLMLGSKGKEIREGAVVVVDAAGKEETIPNDAVFSMIGREAPLEFFRRSNVPVRGEWRPPAIAAFVLFLVFCALMYHWKSDLPHELGIYQAFSRNGWFPFNVGSVIAAAGGRIGEWAGREGNVLYTLRDSMSKPSFY